MSKTSSTKEQAFQKLKQFCGYQERCHQDVVSKLYDIGAWTSDHDEIISRLIEENYLNEERFVVAYASGKFRINQWGRIKIRHELKFKKISEYLIKKAMKEIDEEEYVKLIDELATKKYNSLKGLQYLVRKKRTMDYMAQKGFEHSLVNEAIAAISKGQ